MDPCEECRLLLTSLGVVVPCALVVAITVFILMGWIADRKNRNRQAKANEQP